MDKIIDHLLVFEGQGRIKDFPGNYTQYREWASLQPQEKAPTTSNSKEDIDPKKNYRNDTKRKLSYKEKREFEQLEEEIIQLEEEQKALEDALSGSELSVEEITEKSKRLANLKNQLDEKSFRWLELSELG